MSEITLKAYAKVNIGLDIVGKREDGYHLLKSVMQQVGLYDLITVSTRDDKEIKILSDNPAVPLDESNIAYKAAKRMMDKYQIETGVNIHIDKRIPVAAGMAGGSTDGAAVIKGINELYNLGASNAELNEIGVLVGADVPFCIEGGTMLCEGIGEKMTKLNSVPEMQLLIAKPPIDVSTVHVYKSLKLSELEHPDMDKVLEGFSEKNVEKIVNNMGNVLESVTTKEHEIINILKKEMLDNGAIGSLMSGSGPTVFGIFKDEESSLKAEAALKKLHPTVFVQATGIVR